MVPLLQIFFILTSIAAAAVATAAVVSPASYLYLLEPQQLPPPPSTYTTNYSTLLSTLGFYDFSTAAAAIALPNATTIFSPTDSSLRTCLSCSLSLLLLEHSVTGLYPFRLLRTLPFGTKIQTLATTSSSSSTSVPLCLTVTRSTPTNATADVTVFVGGVPITRPDLYNDGRLIIHGIDGFLVHLSSLSCQVEQMTSLSFPSQPFFAAPFFFTRLWLKDAMLRLRISGYSVLSLLMQEYTNQLLDLKSMTVFAVDDAAVFGDAHAYVSDFWFHAVPNRRITAVDLLTLPENTVLPTMNHDEKLVVTVAGGGGPLVPMRINNVKVVSPDVVYNDGIVVHGIAGPFPRVHQTRSGFWPDRTDDMNLGPTPTNKRWH